MIPDLWRIAKNKDDISMLNPEEIKLYKSIMRLRSAIINSTDESEFKILIFE